GLRGRLAHKRGPVWRAESWPRPAWRAEVVVLYGIGAVNGTRIVLGWQSLPCLSQWQPGGRWKASLTLARAARPEGNGVDPQEGENRRCSPSCPQCGRAGHN